MLHQVFKCKFNKKLLVGFLLSFIFLYNANYSYAFPISTNINLTLVLNGAKFNLAQVPNRLIFLEIFRADCPYCQEEAFSIQKLYTQYRGYFLFIAVDPFDDRNSILDFINFTHVNYPVFMAPPNELSDLDINITPSVYIIYNGSVIGTAKGYHHYNEMSEWLRKIIAVAPGSSTTH
ncbi:MAG: TlpA disulfide reductase family protein [Thermoplasmata archaeon]